MALFKPGEVLRTVNDIDAAALYGHGIRLLFCDIDNTLCPWNDPILPESAASFAETLREAGVSLCILSNNNAERAKSVAMQLNTPYIAKARKPLPFSIHRELRRLNLSSRRAAIVGDQLLTDMLAGNLAGIHTILVQPIDLTREYAGTRVNRFFERALYALLGIRW